MKNVDCWMDDKCVSHGLINAQLSHTKNFSVSNNTGVHLVSSMKWARPGKLQCCRWQLVVCAWIIDCLIDYLIVIRDSRELSDAIMSWWWFVASWRSRYENFSNDSLRKPIEEWSVKWLPMKLALWLKSGITKLTIVVQQLLDEIDVSEQHATAAITTKA